MAKTAVTEMTVIFNLLIFMRIGPAIYCHTRSESKMSAKELDKRSIFRLKILAGV